MTPLLRPVPVALLLVLLLAAAGWALWQATRVTPRPLKVIAAVHLSEVDHRTFEGFKAGLEALGYREGEEVIYLYRGAAGSAERLAAIVAEQAARHPDLFFVSSTPATLAVREATRASGIPVVFAPVNDPVSSGIVANLRAPGGNLTGVRLPPGDALRLQWLTEIAPGVRRVWVPYTPGDGSAEATLAEIRAAAPVLGVELLEAPVGKGGAAALAALAERLPAAAEAIFLPRDGRVESEIAAFAAAALAHRLPLAAPSLMQAEAGALFSYGHVHFRLGRQAARLAAMILAGTPPADIPVEAAQNFLAVNLATATAIGLHLPDPLLRQADYLIR